MNDRMNELAALLASECRTVDEVQNLLRDLFKGTLEAILDAEMDRHLELEKTSDGKDKSGNSRNGYNKKKLQSQFGEIEIRIPRDRKGEFEPRIIGKYQTKTEHLEDQIIEMYAKGMSNREIEAHLRDIYGVCASASLVSKITDKTMPDAVAWQNRPLDPVYPIVIFDGIIIKARSEGRVIDKRVYSALGINTKGYKEILGMGSPK
jgi:transposase-like protein